MTSRASIMGHPIHPVLVVIPMGLLPASVITDIVRFISGQPTWSNFSYWLIIGGIAGGLLAAVFGLIDWSGLEKGSKARAIGSIHAIANVIVMALFGISAYLRAGDLTNVPLSAFILSLLGFALAGFSGFLGGELVFRYGVGVQEKSP
jgi:uncharacterized membrane protein